MCLIFITSVLEKQEEGNARYIASLLSSRGGGGGEGGKHLPKAEHTSTVIRLCGVACDYNNNL